MVKPILLYGCEVWGFSNNDMIEDVHLKFCKLLLHLKSSTPSSGADPGGGGGRTRRASPLKLVKI